MASLPTTGYFDASTLLSRLNGTSATTVTTTTGTSFEYVLPEEDSSTGTPGAIHWWGVAPIKFDPEREATDEEAQAIVEKVIADARVRELLG